METKAFARLVDYETVSLGTQHLIINGQEQTITQKTTVLKCPVCGEILMDLGGEVPDAYVRRILNHDKDRLYAGMKYCPHCGQKLQYETEIVENEGDVVCGDSKQ